jgi:hypothetical protein
MTGCPVTIDTPQSPRSAPVRNDTAPERQVEAEPLPERVDRLAARLIAEDQLGRIAGDDPHQNEDEREHCEQRHAGERQAADDEPGHLGLAPVSRAEHAPRATAIDHVRGRGLTS